MPLWSDSKEFETIFQSFSWNYFLFFLSTKPLQFPAKETPHISAHAHLTQSDDDDDNHDDNYDHNQDNHHDDNDDDDDDYDDGDGDGDDYDEDDDDNGDDGDGDHGGDDNDDDYDDDNDDDYDDDDIYLLPSTHTFSNKLQLFHWFGFKFPSNWNVGT